MSVDELKLTSIRKNNRIPRNSEGKEKVQSGLTPTP
jgi:hypothetical protein